MNLLSWTLLLFAGSALFGLFIGSLARLGSTAQLTASVTTGACIKLLDISAFSFTAYDILERRLGVPVRFSGFLLWTEMWSFPSSFGLERETMWTSFSFTLGLTIILVILHHSLLISAHSSLL